MALAAGSRFGPYEIQAPVGVGGMGEVYRARDPRVQRDVAIKVLPDVVARDPDRLQRFQREAQALASLNHPNIALLQLEQAFPVGVCDYSKPGTSQQARIGTYLRLPLRR